MSSKYSGAAGEFHHLNGNATQDDLRNLVKVGDGV